PLPLPPRPPLFPYTTLFRSSGMLGIPLQSGPHAIVLRFVGSARLWAGFALSATTLLGLLAWLVRPEAQWWRGAADRFLSRRRAGDRKSTRLNSSHLGISYAV